MNGVCVREKGFTLIEVLIAIAILLVGILAIVPLFVLAGETAEINNRRAVAANLASTEIEKIRAMDFADVGLVGGMPTGSISAAGIMTVDGVDYRIHRSVAWLYEGADCTEDDGDAPLWDAKLIQITVTADAPRRPDAVMEKWRPR